MYKSRGERVSAMLCAGVVLAGTILLSSCGRSDDGSPLNAGTDPPIASEIASTSQWRELSPPNNVGARVFVALEGDASCVTVTRNQRGPDQSEVPQCIPGATESGSRSGWLTYSILTHVDDVAIAAGVVREDVDELTFVNRTGSRVSAIVDNGFWAVAVPSRDETDFAGVEATGSGVHFRCAITSGTLFSDIGC